MAPDAAAMRRYVLLEHLAGVVEGDGGGGSGEACMAKERCRLKSSSLLPSSAGGLGLANFKVA